MKVQHMMGLHAFVELLGRSVVVEWRADDTTGTQWEDMDPGADSGTLTIRDITFDEAKDLLGRAAGDVPDVQQANGGNIGHSSVGERAVEAPPTRKRTPKEDAREAKARQEFVDAAAKRDAAILARAEDDAAPDSNPLPAWADGPKRRPAPSAESAPDPAPDPAADARARELAQRIKDSRREVLARDGMPDDGPRRRAKVPEQKLPPSPPPATDENGDDVPQTAAPSPEVATVDPAGDGLPFAVPDAVRQSMRVQQVLQWLMDEKGLRGEAQLATTCEAIKHKVPVLSRVANLRERVARTLSVMDTGQLG